MSNVFLSAFDSVKPQKDIHYMLINVDWRKWTESALFEKSLKCTPDFSYRTSHFACIWDLCAMLRPLLLICVHKRKRERRKEWFKTRTHNFMPVWNKLTQMLHPDIPLKQWRKASGTWFGEIRFCCCLTRSAWLCLEVSPNHVPEAVRHLSFECGN